MTRAKQLVTGVLGAAVLIGGGYAVYQHPPVQMALMERADLPTLQSRVTNNPNDWRTQYWYGKRSAEAGDFVQAEPALRAAFGTAEHFLPAATELGKVLLATGRTEEAFQILRMVVGRDAGQTDAQISLAQLYRLQGAEHRSIEILKLVLMRDPKNKMALYELGAAHEGVDQLNDAEPPLRASLAVDSHFGPALVVLARVKRRQGDLAEATRLAREAVVWSLDQPSAQLELARALAATPPAAENRKAAIAALQSFLPLAQNHPGVRLELGQLLLKDGQPGPAAENLQAAVRIRPDATPAYFFLAQALSQLGRAKDARQVQEIFTRLDAYERKSAEIGSRIGADPDNPNLRYELGELHARNGRLERAVQSYRVGMQRDRGNEKARKRLVELMRKRQPPPAAKEAAGSG